MRAKLILTAVFAAVLGGSFLAKALLEKPDEPAAPGDRPPERIVSMSPHITETLFAMGLGDRVVGVTRFCTYPPEAQTRAQVGGYLDPNYEAILALKPAGILRPDQIHIGIPVLLFTTLVSLSAGLLFGIFPALHVSRTEVIAAIKEGSHSAGRHPRALRSALIVV